LDSKAAKVQELESALAADQEKIVQYEKDLAEFAAAGAKEVPRLQAIIQGSVFCEHLRSFMLWLFC
jgi:hypothetical protein